ncbi:MAG TPA: beta-N-acetylhexosaminidase [Candidatus Limnocylindrales bacterium]|nr:beta-N-acetylhexosaminidase [Candidatus Limnocylindrales bacterium]
MLCYGPPMHGGEAAAEAGKLLIIGLPGPELDAEARRLLADIDPLGVILFRRNVAGTREVTELNRQIRDGRQGFLLCIDHEGGRVHRMGEAPEFTHFPPALTMARAGDPGLLVEVGRAHAAELRAAGFNLDFAPVLDVHTNSDNPVIGDRAFGTTPEEVIHNALPYLQGMTEGGIMGCGKHFPGHGDTSVDSHLELPVLSKDTHDLARLRSLELRPFARAIAQGVPMLMTAHVVVEALDPSLPATMSSRVIEGVLRGELGYGGYVVSDDLEMKAVADNYSVGHAAVMSLQAGCDGCLVCATPSLIREAHEALTKALRDAEIPEAKHAAVRKRREKMLSKLARLERVPVPQQCIGCDAHAQLASRLGGAVTARA